MDVKIKETLNKFLISISNTLNLLREFNQTSSVELKSEFFNECMDFAKFLSELYGFEKEYAYYINILKMVRYTLNYYDLIEQDDCKLVFESLFKFNDLIRKKMFFLSGDISEDDYLNYFNDFVII